MLKKTLITAVDETAQIAAIGSSSLDSLEVFRGTKYLIVGQMVNSMNDANAYSVPSTSTWAAYVGYIYGSNAAPVISVTNANSWNQTFEYANANTVAGTFCFELNTAGSTLTTDMANNSSQDYTLEIISYDNSANNNPQLICSSIITVNGITTEP